MQNQIKIFYVKDWPSFVEAPAGETGYELLDTGDRERLERFGKYTFVRPYDTAVWSKCATSDVAQMWNKVDGKFWSSKAGAKPGWDLEHKVDYKWEMSYKGIKFLASPTPFRHLGFFPEQASHWDLIEEKISKANSAKDSIENSPKIKFLNLFGYTGVASLFALRAGAEVTHLDASSQTLDWAKENQKANPDLEKLPMRVIEDDALKFLEREAKRGNKYDAVVMDPPKFGRGPKGEVWKIEESLPKLLDAVKKVLSDKPIFVILTSYAIDSSSIPLGYALEEAMKDFKGNVEVGELCVVEKSNGRILPLANTAVWTALEK